MNKDNISALLTGVGVVALIVGFAIYFNNPEINKSSLGNNDQGITSDPNSNNGISNVGLLIDKSQFKKAPEFTDITSSVSYTHLTLPTIYSV